MTLRVRDLTPLRITGYYAKLRKTLAPGTVRRTHNALKSCRVWATRRKMIASNPMLDVDAPVVRSNDSRDHTVTEVGYKVVFGCAGRTRPSPPNRAWLRHPGTDT
jgi:hypothetical protein